MTPNDVDAVLRDGLVRDSGLESQVDVDAVLDSVQRRVRRRRHRRRVATVATVAAIVAVGGALASLAYDRREPVQVGPPDSESDSRGEIDADLLWVGVQGPTRADPNTGDTVTIEPRNGITWCATCPFVSVGDRAFTSQGERIYAYTPGDTELRDIGAGDDVFAAADGQSIFVVADSQLEQRTVQGAIIAGPWPIPGGYNLTFPPRATSTGVLVEETANAFIRQLAEWHPSTGEIQPIGSHNRLIDTYIAPDGTTTIARTDCTTNFPCWLLLTDTSTGQTSRVDSPVPGNGFYGGGAFSPDGSQLAVFIATNRGSVNPAARLGIVDVASGDLRVIDKSDVPVGESYGYASWSPSGSWLFFDGLSNNVRALRRDSDEARELHLTGAYSLIAIDRQPTSPAETAVELHLESGAARAQEDFDAPDPRTHTQTIEVTLDPAEASVTIDFTTADGATLHVLTPEPGQDCEATGDTAVCTVRFPILEARSPGEWTVTASKPDGPPAVVSVHVRWERSAES